ncbi:hypothetical protein [Streptomyces shenzhenensis]|uniref:hypothetical protein n=1 Tax=Streptomyces shenzhenensis TaxID=943815 RepID=UPI00369AAA62
MRLATYDDGTGPRAGLIAGDDHVHDAAAVLGTRPLHDVGATATTDELAPRLVDGRLDLDVTVCVNGQTWATSDSRAMARSWPAMVEHASYDGRLPAGDLRDWGAGQHDRRA